MKKFNKKKNLILIICLIAAVSIIVIFVKNRYETPEIDYFEVFGEKYKVENPKKKVYMLNMKSAKIELDENHNSCPVPFKVVFKNGYELGDGVIYTVDGESMAYYYSNAVKENDKSKVFKNNYNKKKKIYWSEEYDFYIMVRFDEPLEKDPRC